jgi:hypothetical protein
MCDLSRSPLKKVSSFFNSALKSAFPMLGPSITSVSLAVSLLPPDDKISDDLRIEEIPALNAKMLLVQITSTKTRNE